MYLHGGGYTCGSLDYAKGYASVLSAECGMKVFTVEYRLAPEHPFPAALFDAYFAYRHLIEQGTPPSKIILAGESAGGGLVYSLCLHLKNMGEELPAGIISISPWVDLTLGGESYDHNKEADPSLTYRVICMLLRILASKSLSYCRTRTAKCLDALPTLD